MAGEATCSSPPPGASTESDLGGVYCTPSSSEAAVSLSPAATKRRMTRERSQPAPADRAWIGDSSVGADQPGDRDAAGRRTSRGGGGMRRRVSSTATSTVTTTPSLAMSTIGARRSVEASDMIESSILNDEKEVSIAT